MNNVKMIALAAALALAMPALAQTPLKPHPMTEKYRDTGTKPATGRSGSAAIEARALLGANGVTDVEVTTGHFEGTGAQGSLAKVQIKVLAPNGQVIQTDNYRQSRTGPAYASFSYDALYHGQRSQVQASVTGIDGNRTDIVTVSTDVKLRPDLEAADLIAPPKAPVGSMVTVSGTVTEENGEVGARATCRLLVDGAEVAAIPGVWIDAASAITCKFRTSFATAGTKRLTLRVTDVSPGDYDLANNEATRSIEVVPTLHFYLYGHAKDTQGSIRTHEDTTITTFWDVSQRVADLDTRFHRQGIEIYGYAETPYRPEGQIILKHATGGTVLPMFTANVADLAERSDYGIPCRDGYFSGGFYALICEDSWVGYTDVTVTRDVGEAIYTTDRVTSYGFYYGEWYDNSGTTFSVPGLVTFGPTYQAELRYEINDGIAYAGAVEIPLAETRWDQEDAGVSCEGGPMSWYGYYVSCHQANAHIRTLEGYGYN